MSSQINFPNGDDIAIDMIVDKIGNCFITGSHFNNSNRSNDIITLMLDSLGNKNWENIFENNSDDKGFGIDLKYDIEQNLNAIFISGYITNPEIKISIIQFST
ncbi:MAG: hypothetical protein R3A12_14615 [Ignavibacteria bacterium]